MCIGVATRGVSRPHTMGVLSTSPCEVKFCAIPIYVLSLVLLKPSVEKQNSGIELLLFYKK